MILEQKTHVFSPPEFNTGLASQLGQNLKWRIPRDFPLEYILVLVYLNVSVAFTSTAVGLTTSIDSEANFLNVIQRINLTVNEGIRPNRVVIDVSGIGLLEYLSRTSFNLPPEVWRAVQFATQRGAAAWPVGTYCIPYLIPLVDDFVSEPLRTGMYLPIHNHTQDPILSLQFNTLATMGLTAGTLANVDVDVMLIRRQHTPASENWLATRKATDGSPLGTNAWGYIDSDLIEMNFSAPLGLSADFRMPLNVPGTYLGFLISQYLGGAAGIVRAPIAAALGDTQANNMGNEDVWRLEVATIPRRQWRDKHIFLMNGFSLCQNNVPVNAAAAAIPNKWNVSPDFVGIGDQGQINANAQFRSPSIYYVDFLSDGKSFNPGNELGSCLDTNAIAAKNLRAELVIKTASVATNPSQVRVLGRKLIGDIGGWQRF